MIAAQAGRGDQEGPRASQLPRGIEPPDDRVQVLHPPAQRLVPAGQVELAERHLGVQGREPVHAVHRAVGQPGIQLAGQIRATGLEHEGGGAE